MKQKIIILDYSTQEVHVFDFDMDKYQDGPNFLNNYHSEHGETFKESQCEWMIVDLKDTEGRLPIYLH
jgi:hypothetical protein